MNDTQEYVDEIIILTLAQKEHSLYITMTNLSQISIHLSSQISTGVDA